MGAVRAVATCQTWTFGAGGGACTFITDQPCRVDRTAGDSRYRDFAGCSSVRCIAPSGEGTFAGQPTRAESRRGSSMHRFARAALASAAVFGLVTVPVPGQAGAADRRSGIDQRDPISTTGTDPESSSCSGPPGTEPDRVERDRRRERHAGAANGTIDHKYDLPADAADRRQRLLPARQHHRRERHSGSRPTCSIPENGLENSSITLALVETASITGTTASSVGVVRDAVGVTDGGVGDTFAFSAPIVGPDGATCQPVSAVSRTVSTPMSRPTGSCSCSRPPPTRRTSQRSAPEAETPIRIRS